MWDNYAHQIKDLPVLSAPTTDADVVSYSKPASGMQVKSQPPGRMPSTHTGFFSLGSLINVAGYYNTTEKTRTNIPFTTTLYGFTAATEGVWSAGLNHQPGFNAMRVSGNSYLNDSATVSTLMPLPSNSLISKWPTPFASLSAFSNSYPGKATDQITMFMPPVTAGNTTAQVGVTFFVLEMTGH